MVSPIFQLTSSEIIWIEVGVKGGVTVGEEVCAGVELCVGVGVCVGIDIIVGAGVTVGVAGP
jgi:hypothetical protein